MKRILALAMLFAIILSIWIAGPASATDPPGDPGCITVHKFSDANGNSVQDPGEGDVEGWLIVMYTIVACAVVAAVLLATMWKLRPKA